MHRSVVGAVATSRSVSARTSRVCEK
jgi:hypothetical protein